MNGHMNTCPTDRSFTKTTNTKPPAATIDDDGRRHDDDDPGRRTSMTAPGWQNKKKKTLKARDSANGKALKAKRGAKMKHDAARARVSGKARTGKQRRKAVRNERRAARNKIDDEAKAAAAADAATGSGDVVMGTA